jgi:enoyl-CoA hydratase/carnithine racemase
VKVVVLTGTDDFYCSGVDFVGSFPVMRPSVLEKLLQESNQRMFDTFILFPKPIIVAANGPMIGAATTSAALCDAIVASDSATFSTPFAALGIVPEGCSSYWFSKVMGEEAASRMLGAEAWCPTADEAMGVGLVSRVVPSGSVLGAAQALAEAWVTQGKRRSLEEKGEVQALLQVNAEESRRIARAFLSPPFLSAMHAAAAAKGKRQLAGVFWTLAHTHCLWSRL